MRNLTIVLAFLFTTQLLAVENELVFPTDVNRLSKAVAQLPDGGTLRIKPGQYEIDEPIVIDKNLTLIGIDGDAANTVITAKDSHCLVLAGKSVKVSKVSFAVESGKGTPEKDSEKLHAVHITSGKHTLNNCRVSSDYGSGISAKGEGTELTAERCVAFDSPWGGIEFTRKSSGKLTDCEVFGCTPSAIYVGSGKAAISGCTVRNNKQYGILFYGQSGVISKCQVYENGYDGIYISGDNVESVTIDDCKVYSNDDGIGINAKGTTRINNCSVYGNRDEQLSYTGGAKVSVKSSSFYDGKYGVFCGKGSSGEFDDCRIYGNGEDGFKCCWSNTSTKFRDCLIYRNTEDGVYVADGASIEMTRCRIYSNGSNDIGTGIRVIDATTKAIFADCKFYDNDTHTRIANESNPVFRNCTFTGAPTIIGNSGKGLFENCDISCSDERRPTIYICKEGDPVFRNCKIHLCITNCVNVAENGKGTFENCEISDPVSSYPAVVSKTGGDPTFKKCTFRNFTSSETVLVKDNGRGTFEQNTFYNCYKMFSIDRTSRVTQRGNTMRR